MAIPVTGTITRKPGAPGFPLITTTGVQIDSHWGAVTADTESDGTWTADLAESDWHLCSLDADVTIVIENVTVGQQFTLVAQQAASGGAHAISSWFDGTIVWVASPYTAPSMPSTASAYLVATFKCIAAGVYLAWWLGNSAA